MAAGPEPGTRNHCGELAAIRTRGGDEDSPAAAARTGNDERWTSSLGEFSQSPAATEA